MGTNNKRLAKRTIVKKSEIIDKEGKLNTLGTFMVTETLLSAINAAFKLLEDLIEDDTEETNNIN